MMRRPHALLAAIAAAILAGCAADSADAAASASAAVGASSSAPTLAAANPDSAARAALMARADLGRIEGREDAKVWIVVISDFQCPFCKRWHEQTEPRLQAEYVRTGKARIAYLNLPISTHRNAPPAHETAMCAAEQGAFWPVADALFASQDRWKSLFDVEPFFDSLAVRHVRDAARYRACIRSGDTRPLIEADVSRINRLGVGSTPTFLIGRQMIVGAQPYDVFARAVDAALAAPATPAR